MKIHDLITGQKRVKKEYTLESRLAESMKLYEFFNVPQDKKEKESPLGSKKTDDEDQKLAQNVFWYIIDHDDLHKEFVLPFVKNMKQQINSPDFNRDRFTKSWMPMVNKGCHLYYKHKKLKDDPKELFPKEMREGLCKDLCEKFIEEINDKAYHIGDHKL